MLWDTDYTKAVLTYMAMRGFTRRRAKTMCKKSGHKFVDKIKKIVVWPYMLTQCRVCEQCGKRMSATKVLEA